MANTDVLQETISAAIPIPSYTRVGYSRCILRELKSYFDSVLYFGNDGNRSSWKEARAQGVYEYLNQFEKSNFNTKFINAADVPI